MGQSVRSRVDWLKKRRDRPPYVFAMVMLLIGIMVGAAAGFSVGWALRNQAHAEVIEAMERRLRNAQRARLRAEEQIVVRRAHSNASIAMIRGELDRTRNKLHEVGGAIID